MCRCSSDSGNAKLLCGVLQRIHENLKHDSNALSQEVEIICGDPKLTPEIRLKALEILQVHYFKYCDIGFFNIFLLFVVLLLDCL